MTKLVTFTFDDGMSKNWELLLNILNQEKIKATFFVIGETITSTNSHLLKRAFDEGHTIGNHTWSHQNITKLSDQDFVKGVLDTKKKIEEVTGSHTKYFRPPYGAINAHNKQELLDLGYTSVLWNVDPEDWNRKHTKEDMLAYYHKVFEKENNYIILQHDLRKDSVDLVPEIAKLVRDKGFKIVSLDDYLENLEHT